MVKFPIINKIKSNFFDSLNGINPKSTNPSKQEKKFTNTPQKTLYSFHLKPDSYLQQYPVGDATVTITADVTGNAQYFIFEPKFRTTHGKESYEKIMAYKKFFGGGKNTTLDDLMSTVENTASDLSLLSEFNENYRQFRYYIKRNILGYDILNVMLNDDNLEDVTCSDYTQSVGVMHSKHLEKHVLRSNVLFDDKHHMLSFMERMANKANKHLSTETPIVDAQVDKWYRMSLIADDILSPKSPALSIRIKSRNSLTLSHLFNNNTISPEIIAVIWAFLDVRGTGLLIGGTGSGKTSLLNTLLCLVRNSAKIITIEDTAEMAAPQIDWLPLIIDAPMESEEYFKKFEAVLNAALRQRPYMISIGEVRGISTKMLFNAISTGHSSLSSFHAYTAHGAVERIIGEMRVHPGSFTSLGFILTMGEIVTRKRTLERRCISFDEIFFDNGTVNLINLVHYDAAHDSFVGNDINDIIEKSKKLRMISRMDATNDITNDLRIRVDLLKECTKQNATTPQAVISILSKYYEKKYRQ